MLAGQCRFENLRVAGRGGWSRVKYEADELQGNAHDLIP